MSCPTCGSKSILNLHCKKCQNLWDENIEIIHNACAQAYSHKLSYNKCFDLFSDFVDVFCKTSIFNKILNDIKSSFDYKIKFEKNALDIELIKIINSILNEYEKIDLHDLFKIISFYRVNYNPNIEINEYNFPKLNEKIEKNINIYIESFLNNSITIKDFYTKLEYENTYLNKDFKFFLKNIILKRIKQMAIDYYFNTEELSIVNKLFEIYPELENHLIKYEKWYNITCNITQLLSNPNEVDFTDYYKLSGSFIINNERTFFCDKNVNFYKMKHRTRIKSNGVGLSIKICNGVYLRPSTYTSTPISEEYLDRIAFGNLILTNKNLIIDGNNYSNKIPYEKILNMQVYSNGIDILFSNREKPIFCQTEYSHIFYSLISMIVKNN